MYSMQQRASAKVVLEISRAHCLALHGMCHQGKDAVPFLEKLVVGDIQGIENGSGTLSVFTNEKGGIIDDSVITKVLQVCLSFRDFEHFTISVDVRAICCIWSLKHVE